MQDCRCAVEPYRDGVVRAFLAASLVQQVPCKDSGITAICTTIDGVDATDNGLNIILVPGTVSRLLTHYSIVTCMLLGSSP